MQTYDLFETLANHLRPAVETMMERAPSYYVDHSKINGDCVEVVYQVTGGDVEQWNEGSIPLEKLKTYIEKEGLNEVENNGVNHHGEHVQDIFDMPVDIFLEDWENRNNAVAEYLRDGGEVIL
ncbi:MAG TPA: hypothetical protein VD907_06850 [Verrucomicrobiae bacterium]|nr:hypothetical protein [Verrucomicrobiae bacterium]